MKANVILSMAVLLFSFLGMANGGEVGGQFPSAATASGSPASPPTFHALPLEEFMEWRVLQAETRALQAEAALAIREHNDKLQALLALWKDRYKIDDMKDWALDIDNRRIKRNERTGTDTKP